MSVFPESFLWGGAFVANQSENAFHEGDKDLIAVDITPRGEHRMAVKLGLEKRFQLRDDEPYPSHEAADLYHRYKEGTALMAEMGFKVFRTSITRGRLFPQGDRITPNQQDIAFYCSVFEECKRCSIEPSVALCHFDVPTHLVTEYGSWRNRKLVELLSRYIRTCFEAFDGLAKYWLAFNEINTMLYSPFSGVGLAFEEGGNQDQVKCQTAHRQLVASALATKITHEVNPQSQAGCMPAGGNSHPYSCKSENVWAALEKGRENLFFIDMRARDTYPVYSTRVFREKRITIDKVPGNDEALKNTVDFISFSYYTSRYTPAEMSADDGNAANVVKLSRNLYLQVSDWGWGINLFGLRITANMMYDHYQKSLFLMEDSLGTEDEFAANDEINNDYRISYLREHIRATGEVIAGGIPLMGYTAQGYIDLVSASMGEVSKRYDFVSVGRDDAGNGTLTHTRKKPFWQYKKVIASNGEDLEQITVPGAA